MLDNASCNLCVRVGVCVCGNPVTKNFEVDNSNFNILAESKSRKPIP